MAESLTAVVLDANESWVEALFCAMPDPVRMHLVRTEKASALLRGTPQRTTRRGGFTEVRSVFVPGLRRFTAVSQRLVTRSLLGFADDEQIDVLICTNPWHAPAFELTPARLKIYYVTDPFDHYAWPREQTIALENRVLGASHLVVSTSIQLAEDFRTRTTAPVEHLPNAVSNTFIEDLRHPLPRPASIEGIDGPIVGVVGQMNDTYDWDLIADLSERLPDVAVVLVGPVMESETSMDRFEAITARPNVHWVGRQPHASLPAYLAAFDVCLNPLRKDERNDRRCPLRLFDYAATRAPIVSTPIREAEYFGDAIEIVEDGESAAARIRALLDDAQPDPVDRSAWVDANTWDARAEQWTQLIDRSLHPFTREWTPIGAAGRRPRF
jgi:glycosyltransferase involved in cell wall biosynthesis